ncbi:MAG: hypothetical protein R3C10_11170 [Pirellulales bacterium]|nr:hypothetical protein [Planctomycetales bacterium]
MSEHDGPSPTEQSPPEPSYAPAAMAMGIAMTAWGILTHWTISLIGAALVVWALWTWMTEVCHTWSEEG